MCFQRVVNTPFTNLENVNMCSKRVPYFSLIVHFDVIITLFLYYLNIYTTIIYVQGIYQCLVCFTIFKRLLFDIETVEATYNWLPSLPEFTLSFDADELINRAECFIGFVEGNIILRNWYFQYSRREHTHTFRSAVCT